MSVYICLSGHLKFVTCTLLQLRNFPPTELEVDSHKAKGGAGTGFDPGSTESTCSGNLERKPLPFTAHA